MIPITTNEKPMTTLTDKLNQAQQQYNKGVEQMNSLQSQLLQIEGAMGILKALIEEEQNKAKLNTAIASEPQTKE